MIKEAKKNFYFYLFFKQNYIYSFNFSLPGVGGQTKAKHVHWVTKVTDTVHSGIKNTLNNWFGRSAQGKQDRQWSLFTQ